MSASWATLRYTILPIGCLNMIQGLRVGAHHDEHHFATIRRILG